MKPFHLGFIGLGIMGAPMVRRLRAQGWNVTAWNLEPERFDEVRASGANWADSPAAVRAASDVVVLCILGDAAIESVCLGPNGLSSASGAGILIDFSTTSAETTRRVAAKLDMDWLDAPMSGGPQAAEEGKLTLMAGGDAALYERLAPVIADVSGNMTLMGPLGAGQMTKVINQAIVGTNYVLMGEVLALATAAGIDAGGLRHSQYFAHQHVVGADDRLVDDLGHLSRPERAHQRHVAAQVGEHRRETLIERRIAAGHEGELALLSRLRSARHRRIEPVHVELGSDAAGRLGARCGEIDEDARAAR